LPFKWVRASSAAVIVAKRTIALRWFASSGASEGINSASVKPLTNKNMLRKVSRVVFLGSFRTMMAAPLTMRGNPSNVGGDRSRSRGRIVLFPKLSNEDPGPMGENGYVNGVVTAACEET
jgi:hypothetical protein